MSEIIDQQQGALTKEISREFFRNVYGYMFGALAISGILASYCGTPEFFYSNFVTVIICGCGCGCSAYLNELLLI